MTGCTDGEWRDELEDLREQVADGDVTPEIAAHILELEAKESEDEDTHLQEILGDDDLEVGWALCFAGEARTPFLECLDLLSGPEYPGGLIVNIDGRDWQFLGTGDGLTLIVRALDGDDLPTGPEQTLTLVDITRIYVY